MPLLLLLLAPPLPKGPAAVVLLKAGCPCARECRAELNLLAAACRGRVRFVGVLDADAGRAKALAREAGLAFPVLPDPKKALIASLKGKSALDLRLVGTEGKPLGSWDGLCRANVLALLARLRETKGIVVTVDPTPFTTLPKVGCAFGTNDALRK